MKRRWNPFDRRKNELEEEIQAHLEMAIADRRDRGESAEDARSGAMRELGNLALVSDVTARRGAGYGWNDWPRTCGTHCGNYGRRRATRLRRSGR